MTKNFYFEKRLPKDLRKSIEAFKNGNYSSSLEMEPLFYDLSAEINLAYVDGLITKDEANYISNKYFNNDRDLTAGMTDDEMDYRFKEAVRIADEKKKIKGLPVARYDAKNDVGYLEYPDGRKIAVDDLQDDKMSTIAKGITKGLLQAVDHATAQNKAKKVITSKNSPEFAQKIKKSSAKIMKKNAKLYKKLEDK